MAVTATNRRSERLDDPAIADLLHRYDGRVPRYTSYPTAPHFHAGVDGETYRAWLEGIEPDSPLSLYLHVPFCERLCWYCGCSTAVPSSLSAVDGYVDLLTLEIGRVAEAIGRRQRVRSIHLGGGTPNILSPAALARIIGAIEQRFDIASGAEIAAECDPRTLKEAWIDAALAIGLNRASLGVQDLDPTVQAAINRVQPWSMTLRAVETLRRKGVASINMDLVYGLPHQSTAAVERTAATVASAAPERIALFGYAHVPWMRPHQRLIPHAALPDPVERFRQQDAAAACLVGAGYDRIGLDHFALPGDPLWQAKSAGAVHRNFQGYTTDAAPVLIGFGASAVGRLPEGYVQNAARVPEWRSLLLSGGLPVQRGIAVTADDAFRAEIIERLMCDLSVDLAEVAGRHEQSVGELMPALLRLCAFERDGLVARSDRILTVTEKGRPFARAVAALFDRYLDGGAVRHSTAV